MSFVSHCQSEIKDRIIAQLKTVNKQISDMNERGAHKK